MVNYGNGKIYKIIDENSNIMYIGSTTQSLCRRYSTHEKKAINHKIILIENYSCNNREELCMREQQIIEQNNNLLNIRKAYSSEEENKKQRIEWYNNNKERVKETQKKYKQNNIEKINQYQQEYQKKYKEQNKTELYKKASEKINCPICNCLVRKSNILRHQKTKKCISCKN